MTLLLLVQKTKKSLMWMLHIPLRQPESIYFVLLMEHKSMEDYSVSMLLLRYMVFIWEDYKKVQLQLHSYDGGVKLSSNKTVGGKR